MLTFPLTDGRAAARSPRPSPSASQIACLERDGTQNAIRELSGSLVDDSLYDHIWTLADDLSPTSFAHSPFATGPSSFAQYHGRHRCHVEHRRIRRDSGR